jgi:heme exporter protein C
MTNRKAFIPLCIGLAAMCIQWLLAWYWVPVDDAQGEVYRIIYLHVPAAFSAFLSAAILLFTSLLSLKSNDDRWLLTSRAATEIGLIFTILTLATGSIWGKPTWGVWWTWDARLTTTLLLALLYGGWILLFRALSPGTGRRRSCAILGLIIALDVPIIYKSVNWWRTLHQPQTILRRGGSTMDSDMLYVLLGGILIMAVISVSMILVRFGTLSLERELEEKSLGELR